MPRERIKWRQNVTQLLDINYTTTVTTLYAVRYRRYVVVSEPRDTFHTELYSLYKWCKLNILSYNNISLISKYVIINVFSFLNFLNMTVVLFPLLGHGMGIRNQITLLATIITHQWQNKWLVYCRDGRKITGIQNILQFMKNTSQWPEWGMVTEQIR